MEWLRSAINAVDDVVVVTDDQNEIVLRNKRAESLFHPHDDDSEGRRHVVSMNSFLFTAALSSWKLEPAAAQTAREVTLIDPIEGSEIVFEIVARPAMNDRDGTLGTVWLLQDIGRLRELAHLKEQDELKSQFLSIASHELRTPITSVSGFAELAMRRLKARLERSPPKEPEWAAEMDRLSRQLGVIHEQSARLGRLVRELLDVSRIQAGRLAFDLRPVDLGGLVRAVVEQMQMVSGDHELCVHLADIPVVVEVDSDHLEQVIANLIDNAIKYSPAGHPIQVNVTEGNGEARVDVIDDGIGIAQAQLPKVFELFFRSGDDESQRAPGLGLGLYIAREIVERHGGRIWLESEIGEGTAVHVALPLL